MNDGRRGISLAMRWSMNRSAALSFDPPCAPSADGAPHRTVLVVDDDPHVLNVIGRMLLRGGYEPVLSGDFMDARMQIELRSPRFLVADVRLGEFNGMHLGVLARRLRPDVRIVFMSGWDDAVLRRTAEEIGGVYLRKPLKSADLLSAMAPDQAVTTTSSEDDR